MQAANKTDFSAQTTLLLPPISIRATGATRRTLLDVQQAAQPHPGATTAIVTKAKAIACERTG